jgi:hypothetical protein
MNCGRNSLLIANRWWICRAENEVKHSSNKKVATIRFRPFFLVGYAFSASQGRSWSTLRSLGGLFLLIVILVMSRLFTETQKFHDFLMLWLVAVNLSDTAQHPTTGSTLSTKAPRVAHMLMLALIVERIGQQQNRLNGKNNKF